MKIFVAGHKGMVGSALCRQLKNTEQQIITADRAELDLLNQQQVLDFFAQKKPDYVYLAAAKVGGIQANNSFPAEFLYENLMIEANIIHAAWKNGVKRLLFLGSSCIYPKLAQQPMSENELLAGQLEPTNEPYAIAKIAGIKLCESYNRQHSCDFRSVMPTNLYGPGDNFHPENSHVVPALMRRIHEAKQNNNPEVTVWGSGKPMREFLHVDDMANACIHIMNLEREAITQVTAPMQSHINIGTGTDCTIAELALTLKSVIGYQGDVRFDPSKPDGTPRKLLDVSLLKTLGWNAQIQLHPGLTQTYQWFLNQNSVRGS